MTTTQIQKVKLIDFTNRHTIYQMLCLLKDLEIDVLTKDFKTYERENHFGHLKDSFEAAELDIYEVVEKFGEIEKGNITDFGFNITNSIFISKRIFEPVENKQVIFNQKNNR